LYTLTKSVKNLKTQSITLHKTMIAKVCVQNWYYWRCIMGS